MSELGWRARQQAIQAAVALLARMNHEDRVTVWDLVHDRWRCTVPGCTLRREEFRRYCAGHRKRLARTGSVQADVPLRPRRKRASAA